jgi:Tfp pilus assembly protein PilF
MDSPILAALKAGDLDGAEKTTLAELQRDPTQPNTWIMAGVLNLIRGDQDLARRNFRRACSIAPNDPGSLCNIGICDAKMSLMQRALFWNRCAEACDTHFAEVYSGKSSISFLLGDLDFAETNARIAIVLDPQKPNYYLNLGNLATTRERLDDKAKWIVRTLTLNPGYPNARFQLATYFLEQGDMRQGLEHYEWRLVSGALVKPRPFALPYWQGEKLNGKLLVWGEQGIGDEVAFAQMLDWCPPGSIVEVDIRLQSIMQRAFREHTFVPRIMERPVMRTSHAVAQVGMGSLLKIGYDAGKKLRPRAFLKPSRTRRVPLSRWVDLLPPGKRIGIAWRSKEKSYNVDARRFHFSLDLWAPILQLPGATFISLQYGNTERELARIKEIFEVDIHQPPIDLLADVEGALALASCLPLQISTGTSACFFGALAGVETWLMLPRSDYTSFGEAEFPWFPNVKTFWRDRGAFWAPVIERVQAELRHTLSDPICGNP